jgi:hypothetical protein
LMSRVVCSSKRYKAKIQDEQQRYKDERSNKKIAI